MDNQKAALAAGISTAVCLRAAAHMRHETIEGIIRRLPALTFPIRSSTSIRTVTGGGFRRDGSSVVRDGLSMAGSSRLSRGALASHPRQSSAIGDSPGARTNREAFAPHREAFYPVIISLSCGSGFLSKTCTPSTCRCRAGFSTEALEPSRSDHSLHIERGGATLRYSSRGQ